MNTRGRRNRLPLPASARQSFPGHGGMDVPGSAFRIMLTPPPFM